MNWKILAIVLIVVAVLVAVYSFGWFSQEEEVPNDGTAESAEGLNVSVDIQSDFWDGFGDWLWANLWWMLAGGLIIGGVVALKKAR